MLDALEKFFIVLTYFNWPQRIWAAAQSLLRSSVTLEIPWDYIVGIDDRDVRAILDAHGIASWGYLFTFDALLVVVPRALADMAENVLAQYGIFTTSMLGNVQFWER